MLWRKYNSHADIIITTGTEVSVLQISATSIGTNPNTARETHQTLDSSERKEAHAKVIKNHNVRDVSTDYKRPY